MLKEDTKQFYRHLRAKTIKVKDHPHMEEVELHWKSLWEEKYNAEWIRREEKEKLRI
jgi:hypothetical protein